MELTAALYLRFTIYACKDAVEKKCFCTNMTKILGLKGCLSVWVFFSRSLIKLVSPFTILQKQTFI